MEEALDLSSDRLLNNNNTVFFLLRMESIRKIRLENRRITARYTVRLYEFIGRSVGPQTAYPKLGLHCLLPSLKANTVYNLKLGNAHFVPHGF